MQLKNKIISLLTLTSVGTLGGAIALPHLFAAFSCGGPPPKSEAQVYVGTIVQGQENYFTEKNAFANSIDELNIGLENQTQSYQYSTRSTSSSAFSYGVARKDKLKSYVGAVFVVPANHAGKATKGQATTVTILCEANSPGKISPSEPTYQNGVASCGTNTTASERYY